MNKFLIFAHSRSGSSALRSVFNVPGEINCGGEPFINKRRETYTDIGLCRHAIPAKPRQLDYWLDRIYLGYDGFKTLYEHLTPELNLHMLRSGLKVIPLSSQLGPDPARDKLPSLGSTVSGISGVIDDTLLAPKHEDLYAPDRDANQRLERVRPLKR